ncbi:hypothetical protein DFH07DRAFT_688773, partial [Mycena maculata]
RDERSSKKQKLNVEARLLTSVEGKRLAAARDLEWAAKEKKKSDGDKRRREKENARNQNRQNCDPDAAFTGLLTAKNKDDLMDIAWSLDLPEDGMKLALLERINTYFRHHTDERDSPKYAGLFTWAARGRRAAVSDAAVPALGPPQASTSHIPVHPDQ